jgi:hypothetical protein
MSHTISYKHVAIQFSCYALKNALPDSNFYMEHFILLELHGDNNVTTINPYSRREVGCLHWITEAIGDGNDIVRNAIRSSVFCEGGDLRFYGQRYTTPESYIRRVRNALKNPVSAYKMDRLSFEVIVELKESHLQGNAPRIELLNEHATSYKTNEGVLVWRLRPLISVKDAALLFTLKHIDTRAPWEFITTEGPCFEQEAPELFMSSMAA